MIIVWFVPEAELLTSQCDNQSGIGPIVGEESELSKVVAHHHHQREFLSVLALSYSCFNMLYIINMCLSDVDQ